MCSKKEIEEFKAAAQWDAEDQRIHRETAEVAASLTAMSVAHGTLKSINNWERQDALEADGEARWD